MRSARKAAISSASSGWAWSINMSMPIARGFIASIAVERPGQHSPVERRALAELLQRLVIIGDEDDSVVLLERPLGGAVEAQVVERPLGVAEQRHVPVEAGDVEAGGDEEQGGEQADPADLPEIAPEPRVPAAFHHPPGSRR